MYNKNSSNSKMAAASAVGPTTTTPQQPSSSLVVDSNFKTQCRATLRELEREIRNLERIKARNTIQVKNQITTKLLPQCVALAVCDASSSAIASSVYSLMSTKEPKLCQAIIDLDKLQISCLWPLLVLKNEFMYLMTSAMHSATVKEQLQRTQLASNNNNINTSNDNTIRLLKRDLNAQCATNVTKLYSKLYTQYKHKLEFESNVLVHVASSSSSLVSASSGSNSANSLQNSVKITTLRDHIASIIRSYGSKNFGLTLELFQSYAEQIQNDYYSIDEILDYEHETEQEIKEREEKIVMTFIQEVIKESHHCNKNNENENGSIVNNELESGDQELLQRLKALK